MQQLQVRIARMLEPLPLSYEELFTFSLSPTDMTDPASVEVRLVIYTVCYHVLVRSYN